MLEGERISYAWTLDQARKNGDARSINKLESIGVPPYPEPVRPKVVTQRAILAKYRGEVHGNTRGGVMIVLRSLLSTREYVAMCFHTTKDGNQGDVLQSSPTPPGRRRGRRAKRARGFPHNGWLDRFNFFRGIFASMDLLWPQIMSIDLVKQVPKFEVPVYFLLGRHDMEAPSVLAEQYFHALVAPRKRLLWFERSAHFINVEEADAFNRFFTDELVADSSRRE